MAGRWVKVNAGGWPARPKTVFNTASRRKADKASNTLLNAKMHIFNTVERDANGFIYDHVRKSGDIGSSEALNLIDVAISQILQEDAAAQVEAKTKELAS